MQSVKLLILFMLWIISMASFSFLVFPMRGEMVGLSIALIYLYSIYLFLDKWVLLFFLATSAQRGDELLERFQNMSYGHNVKDVKFYYSRFVFGNVLAFEWAGKKTIIIDKSLNKSPESDECLIDVLTSFRTGTVKRNTFLLFVFAVYNLPIVYIEKLFSKLRLVNLFVSVWMTPFQFFCEDLELIKKEKRVGELDYNGTDTNLGTFAYMLVRIIGIYKNNENDLVSMIFKKDYA